MRTPHLLQWRAWSSRSLTWRLSGLALARILPLAPACWFSGDKHARCGLSCRSCDTPCRCRDRRWRDDPSSRSDSIHRESRTELIGSLRRCQVVSMGWTSGCAAGDARAHAQRKRRHRSQTGCACSVQKRPSMQFPWPGRSSRRCPMSASPRQGASCK